MATPSPLKLPHSDSTADIQIIDNGTWIGNCTSEWAMSPIYPGLKVFSCPAYSFLITHRRSSRKVLFDLALRKDFNAAMNPEHLKMLKNYDLTIAAREDVADVLTRGGTPLDSIEAIVWSHHHWDHVGNPATFPPSTKIIVGPGFRDAFLPGYPADPAGEIMSDAFDGGRELQEIEFEPGLTVGQYRAHDYFDDGSLYLLDTPGHTIGHISALVRTTSSPSSTFIFLGGDIVHHAAVFRPTQYLPLPQPTITPNPLKAPFSKTQPSCPCEIFAAFHQNLSPRSEGKGLTVPFSNFAGPEHDLPAAQRSCTNLFEFDGHDDVFTIFAHDTSLMDVLDYYPHSAAAWKEQGWKREGHWRFLAELIPPGHELYHERRK